MSEDFLCITQPSHELEYRCVGIVFGKYVPSEEDNLGRGTFFGKDETEGIPAFLSGRLLYFIKKNRHILDSEQYWGAYIRTFPEMRIQLKSLRTDIPEGKQPKSDVFSIRGIVKNSDLEKGTFEVMIKRGQKKNTEEKREEKKEEREENKKQPENTEKTAEKKDKPFKITLKGTVSERARGKFYEFLVKREGKELVVCSAKFVASLPEKPYRPKNRGRYFNNANRQEFEGKDRRDDGQTQGTQGNDSQGESPRV